MRRPRQLLAAALVVASAHLGAQPSLDAGLEELRKREGLTGQVWAIVEGGQVRTGATGWANAATQLPMTASTRVQVGSVTKTIVALALLKAVSDGLLDLDAEVSQLLPEVPIANPWAATHPLRLRHLLDMTGGLEDLRMWHMASTRNTHDAPLAHAVTGLDPPLAARTAPGTQFSYSNLSFTLAAMALEKRVGQRYEDWARHALLVPLGLRDSSLHPLSPGATGADGRGPVAWGHLEDRLPMAPPPIAIRPAAQFVTTAGDMGQLALFLLRGSLPDGSRPIRADLLRDMGHAVTTHAWQAGLRTGYGLGLSTRDRDGAVGRCHGGSIAGFRAMLCLFDGPQKAFFIAHNMDDENARYDHFDRILVGALGVAAAPPPAPGGALDPPREDDRAWTGVYVPAPSRMPQLELLDRLAAFRLLDIGARGASIRNGFGAAQPLHPAGPRLYRQETRQVATWALLGTPQQPDALTSGLLTLRRVPAAELAALWAVVLAGAIALVGWLAVPTWRHARGGPACWRQPAWWGMVVLLVCAALLAAKPWRALGDHDAVAIAVYAATLLLPLAGAAQLALQLRDPARRRQRGLLAMWSAGLALLAVLAAYGLLPLALWRL